MLPKPLFNTYACSFYSALNNLYSQPVEPTVGAAYF